MTKAKRWPNNAEWARLDSIALAEKAAHSLRVIRDRTTELSTVEIVRRTAEAIDACQMIVNQLQAAKAGKEHYE